VILDANVTYRQLEFTIIIWTEQGLQNCYLIYIFAFPRVAFILIVVCSFSTRRHLIHHVEVH
jgi:hypothetical protein